MFLNTNLPTVRCGVRSKTSCHDAGANTACNGSCNSSNQPCCWGTVPSKRNACLAGCFVPKLCDRNSNMRTACPSSCKSMPESTCPCGCFLHAKNRSGSDWPRCDSHRQTLSLRSSRDGLSCLDLTYGLLLQEALRAWVLRLPSVCHRKMLQSSLQHATNRSVRSKTLHVTADCLLHSVCLQLICRLLVSQLCLCRAAAEIKAQGGKGRIEAMELDLTSFR